METNGKIQASHRNTALLIEGAVYNGELWTKGDLIKYLEEALSYIDKIAAYSLRRDERDNRKRMLLSQMKRRTLTMPFVAKPTGLALLSPSKRRLYAEWLANAPARDRQQAKFDRDENTRIRALQAQMEQLDQEGDKDRACCMFTANDFRDHMLEHVLAPDYRTEETMRKLLAYLANGRANTLQEALNLFHQESHWQSLENAAKAQQEEIRRAQRKQEAMMREQMALQREIAEEQNDILRYTADAAKATQRAAEETNLWLMLDYFSDRR